MDTNLHQAEEPSIESSEVEKATSEPQKNPSLLRRIFQTAYNAALAFTDTAAILAAAGTLYNAHHFNEIHPEITVTAEQNGTKTYSHPDPQTTHILNYLAGRESLSYEERLRLVLRRINMDEEAVGSKFPPGFENMTLDQAAEALVYNRNSTNESIITFDEGKKMIEEDISTEFIPAREEFPHGYETVWEMEKRVGAPKIRFAGTHRMLGQDPSVAHYSCDGNTVFVSGDTGAMRTLVAEYSHALQCYRDGVVPTVFLGGSAMIQRIYNFRKTEDPSFNFAQYVSDYVKMEQGNWEVKTAYQKAYAAEYTTPGSIEYEAHKIIEPILAAEFDKKNIPLTVDKDGKKTTVTRP